MGKRFDREINEIPHSLKTAFSEPLTPSCGTLMSSLAEHPLLVVGSGGSFSAAHFVARLHEEITGQTARALTPLEFVFSRLNPGLHGVLFLTASGNNKDIISAFDHAIRREFLAIGILCMTVGSKIVQRCKKYNYVHVLEYSNAHGKDGFLAVNSLLSTCVLAARAYGAVNESKQTVRRLAQRNLGFSDKRLETILSRRIIVALGGEWAWPALVDLESKFTEAALGSVLISDFRNFAHGRHNWFDKKGDDSSLLVLETPPLSKLAKRTMELLPEEYPRAVMRSSFEGPLAGIDLCKQIIHFVDEAGKMAGIDPGRPRVPEFGRKMYHIGLSLVPIRKVNSRGVWIQRKTRVSNKSAAVYKKSLSEFLEAIQDAKFVGVVFDYDGTLCDPPERFDKPKIEISTALSSLLSKGIPIGVATGRGRSVQRSLQSVIDEAHWDRVLVGNYNGSIVLPLKNEIPSDVRSSSKLLQRASKLISNDLLLSSKITIELRAKQLSVAPKEPSFPKQSILKRVREVVASEFGSLKIVQSDHSIDILHANVTKLGLVEALASVVKSETGELLIIGDQGQCGGNDFEMLSLPYSLSVDKVSSSPTTCWNLSPVGLRGAAATLALIKAFDVGEKHFHLNVNVLEEESS